MTRNTLTPIAPQRTSPPAAASSAASIIPPADAATPSQENAMPDAVVPRVKPYSGPYSLVRHIPASADRPRPKRRLGRRFHTFEAVEAEGARLLREDPTATFIIVQEVGTMKNKPAAECGGLIVRRADVMSGVACVAGTRIPVSAIMSFHKIGHTPSQIVDQYPDLSPETVERVIAHLASEAER